MSRLALVVPAVLLATMAAAAGLPADANLTLRLGGAVWGEDLLVTLERRGGEWMKEAWGYAPNASKAEHEVVGLEVTEADGGLRFDLVVQVNPDPWVLGGMGRYQVVLRPGPEGWRGASRGTFRGNPADGTARMEVGPPWPQVVPVRPLAPEEHPRFGPRPEVWVRPPDRVTEAGNQAMREVISLPSPPWAVEWSSVVIEAARKYDRFYFEADPEIRLEAAAALLRYARMLMFSPQGMSTPWHNWQGGYRAGAGMAALAILGDPVPRPERPPMPDFADLEPETDRDPPDGVPVVDLNLAGRGARQLLSRTWLSTGSAPSAPAADPAAPDGPWWTPGGQVRAGDADLEVAVRTFPEGGERGALPLDDVVPQGHTRWLQAAGRVRERTAVRIVWRAGTRIWVSGVAVEPNQVLVLAPGWHPIRVEIRSGRRPPGSVAFWTQPTVAEVKDPRVELDTWRTAVAHWEEHGHASEEAARIARLAEINVHRFQQWAIGDGGFTTETETYTAATFGKILPFAEASLGITGRNLITGTHSEWLPVRARWGRLGGRNLPGHFSGGEGLTRFLAPETRRLLAVDTPADFPGHALRDVQKASAIFRNGFRGADEDIVVVVEGKGQHLRGAWTMYNAGTLRLFGRGQPWTFPGSYARGLARENHSLVLFPDDDVNGTLPARVTHFEAHPDGSGQMAMNLDLPAMRYPEGAGNLVDFEGLPALRHLEDLGIRHTRIVAADFSRRSGAPLLLVVVDRIDGGRRRVWQWNAGPGLKFEAHDDGFELRAARSDERLRCRMLTPTGPATFEGGMVRVPGDGHFLAVITLGPGDPPEVTAEGEGLDATMTVGTQRFRIVDDRVVWMGEGGR